jgi:hypothetical protein
VGARRRPQGDGHAPIGALAAAPVIWWVAPVYRVDGLDGDAGLVSPPPNVLVFAPRMKQVERARG